MGEKNNQINEYLSDTERFADFCNANLFPEKSNPCGRIIWPGHQDYSQEEKR